MAIGDDDKQKLEAFKVEYQKAADRYDNIYKAIWTNFSYMAIVSGGILTFGKDKLGVYMAGLLAYVPLLFWWLASFEPMNRYGDRLVDRLAEIEKRINTLLNMADNNHAQGLRHFINYQDRSTETSLVARAIRVRHMVRLFGGLFTLITIYLGINAYYARSPQRIDEITASLKGNRLEINVTGKDLKEIKDLLQLKDVKMTTTDLQGNPRELRLNLNFKDEADK